MFGYATFAEVTFAEGERREAGGATIVTAAFSSSGAATVAFVGASRVRADFASSGAATAAFVGGARVAADFASSGVATVAFIGTTAAEDTSTILQRHPGGRPLSRKRFLDEIWPLIQAAERKAKELERLRLREAKRKELEERRREEERAAIAAAEAVSQAYTAILSALDEQHGDEAQGWLAEARERLGVVEETITKASPLLARSAVIAKAQSTVQQERSAKLAKYLADAAIKRAQISAKRQAVKDQYWYLQNQDDEDEAIALLLLH